MCVELEGGLPVTADSDVDGVKFLVADLRDVEDVEPGFYYTIVDAEEPDFADSDQLIMAGPYPTNEAAVEAAQDFIISALMEGEPQEESQ